MKTVTYVKESQMYFNSDHERIKKKKKTQKYLTSTEKWVRLLTYICETLMILDYLGVSVLLCISTAQIESYYYQYNILCICSKIEIPAWTVFPFGHSY